MVMDAYGQLKLPPGCEFPMGKHDLYNNLNSMDMNALRAIEFSYLDAMNLQ